MVDISKTFNINTTNYHPSINASIIITPYEKVLKILNNVKQYINSTSKLQSKLIKNLDWVIKVITSHSLYSYELKEKDVISKLAKQNTNFKNFVDFVSKYNEQVIEMNKRNIKLGAKTIEVANELLQKPSIKLKKNIQLTRTNTAVITPNKYLISKNKGIKSGIIKEKNESHSPSKSHTINVIKNENKNHHINKIFTNIPKKEKSGKNLRYNGQISIYDKNNFSNLVGSFTTSEGNMKKKSDIIKEPKIYFIDIDKYNTKINLKKNKKSFNKNRINIERFNGFNNIKEIRYIENLNKSQFNLTLNNLDLLLANEPNFNPKLILQKDFNILI